MQFHIKCGVNTLVVEGAGEKELFESISKAQEVFGQERCGACSGEHYSFRVREVDDNKYYELHCTNSKCRARLEFGQHKKGGTLYPKRKTKEGEWLENNGWTKWDGKKKDES